MNEQRYLAVYEVKQYERIASHGKAADFGDARGGTSQFIIVLLFLRRMIRALYLPPNVKVLTLVKIIGL